VGQVISREQLLQLRPAWKRQGLQTAFAAGAFDLLHPGHIRLLEQAHSLAQIVVVGVFCDAVVRAACHQAQGPARPITPSSERAEILAALAAVDFAFEFDPSRHSDWLASFAPDIYIVGDSPASSSRPADSHGHSIELQLESIGAKIVRIPLEPGHSTERLIARILSLCA
jgi:cytidyltransferase-like protein